jgi:prepilin-type N-terminal cleavage/methylation domain-containing protein/prepilin-type processing-associated H-X9-DG protein
MGGPHQHRRRGFTLVELLIVIGIIGVLVALIVPATGKTREQARRAHCASNARQICLAAIRYAQDHPKGAYIPTPDNDNDTFEAFYPSYMKDLRVFVCPSTQNAVNGVADLRNNAVGGRNGTRGHSYEIRAWAEPGIRFPDGRSFPVLTLKNYRQFPNGAAGCLIMDGDDSTENGDQNNWPSRSDNHGVDGFNVGFMDGHVEFLPPARKLLEAFLEGYYDPGLPDSIYMRHGIVKQGNTFRYGP